MIGLDEMVLRREVSSDEVVIKGRNHYTDTMIHTGRYDVPLK